MIDSLYFTAKKTKSQDTTTKPLSYYAKYDNFLNHHNILPNTILEIGVWNGESTKILSETFRKAKIVGIDLVPRYIDFDAYSNITYIQADQSDSAALNEIIKTHFPNGIDLVIEDASHVGSLSKATFDIVFPHVKIGGAYFIEDWGTGYWSSFLDGSDYESLPIQGKRIPSHDYGMVGFVKSLVDLTHGYANKPTGVSIDAYESPIRALEFGEGVCMILKGSN